MSELDRRFAYVWEPFVISLITLFVVALVAFQLRSELRDAQHRIAILEQQCK